MIGTVTLHKVGSIVALSGCSLWLVNRRSHEWQSMGAICGRESLDPLHSAGAIEPLSPLLGLGHEAEQSEDPAGLPWPAILPPAKNILDFALCARTIGQAHDMPSLCTWHLSTIGKALR